jgi:type IV secretion system protein VirD4
MRADQGCDLHYGQKNQHSPQLNSATQSTINLIGDESGLTQAQLSRCSIWGCGMPSENRMLKIYGTLAVMSATSLALAAATDGNTLNYITMVGTRFQHLLLTVVVGFVFGAALSPQFKAIRRYILLAALALAVAYGVFGTSPLSFILNNVTNVIAGLVAFAIGMRLGAEVIKRRERPRPTSYGSAKWATYDYLSEKQLLGDQGFLLGRFQEEQRSSGLCYGGARHMLTVAPTRSGKGVATIIPNLLYHRGSALVVDPKGENALITALRRGDGDAAKGIPGLGQRIILLDPWDIAASKLGLPRSRFNPLDWIKAGDPDAAENAFILADALVVKEGGSEAAFWDEEAKSLLTGLIMHVATSPSEEGLRHLGRVREILTLTPGLFGKVLKAMLDHPDPLVVSTAARTMAKEEKLISGVMATAQAHTHFLESPRIEESLIASDFSFEDLKTGLVTVYLILPADRLNTFNRWLRLLIQQAITINARNIDVKPKAPILFMLDEMPTLGKLPSVEQAYGLMAGFGMQLWGIVQDLSQLAKIYGEHGWQTFISNSGVIQYFGSRDRMTADYFSKLCGVTTIEVHNFSWAVGKVVGWTTGSSTSSGAGGGSSGTSSSRSESHSWTRTTGVSEAQRQLAYPDELMVLKGEEQIVFVENLDPIIAFKTPWYEDAEMKTLGVDLQSDAGVAPTKPVAAIGMDNPAAPEPEPEPVD